MDFLGMLGIPVIPVPSFPEHAPVIFLPAQAAADPDLFGHITWARQRGAHIVMPTGLLLASPQGDELAHMLGITAPLQSQPMRANLMQVSTQTQVLRQTDVLVDLEDITCSDNGKQIPLLYVAKNKTITHMALLNTHTFNQADFDAVGDVLLCPHRLGLLDLLESTLSLLKDSCMKEKAFKRFLYRKVMLPVYRDNYYSVS